MAGQRTTAAPQTTAPTKDPLSDAQAPASTDPQTRPSLPLDPPITDATPAARPSECAHEWMISTVQTQRPSYNLRPIPDPKGTMSWCQRCGALWYYDRILVPAAAPTSSTSAKQASAQPVAPSNEGSAESRSPSLTETLTCGVGKHQFPVGSSTCGCGAVTLAPGKVGPAESVSVSSDDCYCHQALDNWARWASAREWSWVCGRHGLMHLECRQEELDEAT